MTPLGRILEKEGRRQNWLAERSGLSKQRVHLIVHGLHPDEDEAAAIAEALGRDVAELFDLPEHAA